MRTILLLIAVLFHQFCHGSQHYKIRVLVEKPGNFSLFGEVGQQCLNEFRHWNPPFQQEKYISHQELISILPVNHSSIGLVFKPPNEDFFMEILMLIDPAVRRSRYDPLDPNARASSISYGILQSISADEFMFAFR